MRMLVVLGLVLSTPVLADRIANQDVNNRARPGNHIIGQVSKAKPVPATRSEAFNPVQSHLQLLIAPTLPGINGVPPTSSPPPKTGIPTLPYTMP